MDHGLFATTYPEDRLRVLPKGETTKPLRCKARPSSVKLYSELLRQFDYITLACDICMRIDKNRSTLRASVTRNLHKCQRTHLVLFAKANDEFGIVIRSRGAKFNPTESSSMCEYVSNGMKCFSKEKCRYPHSLLESKLWARDFTHEISISRFMQDLDSSSLRSQHLVTKVTDKFSGEFLLLCKACFKKDGSGEICRKSRHLPQCRQGHGWTDNEVFVFQRVTGKLTVFGDADSEDEEIEDSVSRILDYGLTFEDIVEEGRKMKQRTLAARKTREIIQCSDSFLEDFDLPGKTYRGLSSDEIFDNYFNDLLDPAAFGEDTGDSEAPDYLDNESRPMPKRRPYYTLLATYDLLDPENYRQGTIHLQGRFDAVCEVGTEADVISIQLKGRANCGPAFDGDKVCIELVRTRDRDDDKQITRGKVVDIRERRINRCARVFVCTVDRNQSNLMTPLCGSVPKIQVIDTALEKAYGREKKNYVDVYRMENGIITWMGRTDLKRKDQEHKLFAVKYLKWYHWCPFPLGYVCKVLPINKDFDVNQNVINLLHQINMSEMTEVDPYIGEYVEYVGSYYERASIDDERENLEYLVTFSIDPGLCRCVDDAFSIEKVNADLFQVWVHISDVSHLVEKGEDIDIEAQAKGRTFCSANRSKTSFMLPNTLATDVLSLKEGKRRLAISVYFVMDSRGRLQEKPRIMKSVVVNKRQLTYREAQDNIKRYRCVNHCEEMNEIDQRIMHLHKLAQNLRASRLNNAQHYYPCRSLDDNNNPSADGQCHDAHRLVEEFMILTNRKIADFLLRNSSADLIPLRQQKKPQSAKLNRWVQRHGVMRSLSSYFDQFPTVDELQNISSSIESIALLQSSWTALQDALKAGDAEKVRVVIGSEQRHPNHCLSITDWWNIQEPVIFSTSTDNQQHFSLHVPHYVQFTSPIRRYMDIVAHRLVTDVIRNGDIYIYTSDEIQAICEKANRQTKMSKSYKQSCELLLIADRLKVPQFLPCFVKKLTPFAVLLEVPYLIKTEMNELTISYSELGVNSLEDHSPQDAGSIDYSQVTLVWRKRFFDKFGHRTINAREAAQTEHPYRLNPEQHGQRISTRDWQLIQGAIVSKQTDEGFIEEIKDIIEIIERKNEIFIANDTGIDFVTDVTSEMKKGKMLVNHYVSFCLTLKTGSILPVQFVGEVGNALLQPEIKMVNLTSCKDVCVEHRKNPLKCFPNSSVPRPTSRHYRDPLEYIEAWSPILDLESVTSAVTDGESILCSNVPVSFRSLKSFKIDDRKCGELFGNLMLPLSFCTQRQIKISRDCKEADFMHDYLCIRSEGTADHDHFSEFKRNVWTCHAVTVSAYNISDQDVVTLRFKVTSYSAEPPGKLCDGKEHPCAVELLYRTLPNKRMIKAVNNLPKSSEICQRIALCSSLSTIRVGLSKSVGTSYDIVVPEDNRPRHEDNQSQRNAIGKALTEPFTLIQGPPGTGKTVVGVKIAYWFSRTNLGDGLRKQVLYCGPSNSSVDVVAKQFQKLLGSKCPKVVRIYSKRRETMDYPIPRNQSPNDRRDTLEDDPDIRKISLHHILRDYENPDYRQRIADNGRDYRQDIVEFDRIFAKSQPEMISDEEVGAYKKLVHEASVDELKHYDIVLSTCSASACQRLVQGCNIVQLIVDECAMCTEPESLIPLVAFDKVERVVLIGDHKQLQPIIRNREAKNLGLKVSLFERYSAKAHMLDVQYRMHTSICEFPSKQFYEGKLKTGNGSWFWEDRNMLKIWPNPNYPMMFCHVEGVEKSEAVTTPEGNENSKSNKQERDHVLRIVKQLIQELQKAKQRKSIAILSQYKAQCSAIKTEVELLNSEVRVSTVVASQGGEWDIVILSTVRSLPDYEIDRNASFGWCWANMGFICDEHQINVALTRAKIALIIVGNKNLLKCHRMWKALLEHYESNRCVVDADEFLTSNK